MTQETTAVQPENTAETPANTEVAGAVATPEKVEEGTAPDHKPASQQTFTKEEVDGIAARIKAKERAKRERAEVEADTYRRMLADQGGQKPKAQATTDEQAPKREDFEEYEEYIRADTRFVARQELKSQRAAHERQGRDQQEQEREIEVGQKYSGAVTAALDQFEDFEEHFATFVRLPIPDKVGVALREAIAESDIGPQLLHHLASNPAEVERLAKFSPFVATKELGKIEARLATATTTSTAAPAKTASVSKAPEPIEPGGGKGSTTGSNKPPTDPEAYRAWRTKEREAEAAKART